MAMPETHIGLFPDVGGGFFLSRLAGACGEYLGLTGQTLGGSEAVAAGLADAQVASSQLPHLWAGLTSQAWSDGKAVLNWLRSQVDTQVPAAPVWQHSDMQQVFALPTVMAMMDALTTLGQGPGANATWAQTTLAVLHHRSPLMLCVVLEQIRRARGLSLADDLRMERDMVRHCFHLRPVADSETVEGIRALAVDKDKQPQWKPQRVSEVDGAEVEAFFSHPWPAHAHPLRGLT
jgi:enoyl-CoA hydratase